MVDVILFHHAQGLTPGVAAFADELRNGGHQVTVPDLYDGATFPTLEEGVAHAETLGFENLLAAGEAAAADAPAGTVYAGFSLGAMPAQKLAQTRPGAGGALLYHSDIPVSQFAPAWPAGVPVQLHLMEDDEWADVEAAREIAAQADDGEAFVYPGAAHLYADSSLSTYDEAAANLTLIRTLEFLARLPR